MLLQTGAPVGKILEASDGQEALEVLRTEKVNLILTDLSMPNMDGLRLLRHLRRSTDWKDVPVIIITTEGAEAKVHEAVELGANGYVHKPFTVEKIREKLDNVR